MAGNERDIAPNQSQHMQRKTTQHTEQRNQQIYAKKPYNRLLPHADVAFSRNKKELTKKKSNKLKRKEK